MASRLELSKELHSLIGSNNVYFQPPESYKISYPCIIYELDRIDTIKADNLHYKNSKRYSVTIIDRNPDSTYPEAMLKQFKYCSFDRCFTSDNLHHFVFTIYY